MTFRLDWIAIGFGFVASIVALVFLPRFANWTVAGLVAALIFLGTVFWITSREGHDTSAELGKLLLFGIAAALPSLIVSHAIEQRQAKLEDAFEARERAQDLQLQIGFQGSLRGVNLRGRDLTGFQLRGRDLAGADLTGATLTDANLAGAELDGARLDGARLDGAYLAHASLKDATLAGASLRRTVLFSADLEGACFAARRTADGTFTPTVLNGAHLAGADVAGASFAGADLRRAKLSEDLRDVVHLDAAVLTRAATAGASLPAGAVGSPAPAAARAAKVRAPPNARADVVQYVSDGDTLMLRGLGKVQLLGVSAPGTDDDPTGFGRIARRYARTQLADEAPVRYATIAGADGRPLADPFGRTFAYVWRTRAGDGPAGWFINERLVRLGYAKTAKLADTLGGAPMRALHAGREAAWRAGRRVWSTCVP